MKTLFKSQKQQRNSYTISNLRKSCHRSEGGYVECRDKSPSVVQCIQKRKIFRANQEIIRHNSQEQYQNNPVYQRCKTISDSQEKEKKVNEAATVHRVLDVAKVRGYCTKNFQNELPV